MIFTYILPSRFKHLVTCWFKHLVFCYLKKTQPLIKTLVFIRGWFVLFFVVNTLTVCHKVIFFKNPKEILICLRFLWFLPPYVGTPLPPAVTVPLDMPLHRQHFPVLNYERPNSSDSFIQETAHLRHQWQNCFALASWGSSLFFFKKKESSEGLPRVWLKWSICWVLSG